MDLLEYELIKHLVNNVILFKYLHLQANEFSLADSSSLTLLLVYCLGQTGYLIAF